MLARVNTFCLVEQVPVGCASIPSHASLITQILNTSHDKAIRENRLRVAVAKCDDLLKRNVSCKTKSYLFALYLRLQNEGC